MNCDRCGTELFDNETGRCVSCYGNRDPNNSALQEILSLIEANKYEPNIMLGMIKGIAKQALAQLPSPQESASE